ncbi:MAG: hypothetical protein AB7F35_18175 [Acetobacteraceae bacterium]
MRLPAPRCPRDLFQAFAAYSPETGLDGLLRQFDFSGVPPRQAYYALFGRAPEKRAAAVPQPRFAAQTKFARGLASDEFRRTLIPQFLEAFPEKKRLLFLHIPKTAGSELSARLMRKYPYLSSQTLQPGWGTTEAICAQVRSAVLRLAESEHVLICGHNTLQRYRDWRAVRYDDRLFAVLRDPVRATMSQVNYVLTRMFLKVANPEPDIVSWRRLFGVSEEETGTDKGRIVELASRILRNQNLVPAGRACRFLGGTTAEAAIDLAICYDVDLTDVEHLDTWCSAQFGIEEKGASNISQCYVSADDLSPADLDHIGAITTEDARLYAVVRERMERLGAPSVRGVQLA